MRFLGGKWQKKNNGNGNGNRISRFTLRASLGLRQSGSAFGRL
jgi:hypothetical protein